MKKESVKRVFVFKKGCTYAVDQINAPMNPIGEVSHKPKILDAETNEQFEDCWSDEDIFDKTVKITIEIID